jgi:hypothetical protein
VGWLEILQPAHLKFFQPANLEDRYCSASPVTPFTLCSLLPYSQPIKKIRVTILALGDMSKFSLLF